MKLETREWVRKAEKDWLLARSVAADTSIPRSAFHDQTCFLCQQSAEKYLKAMLQESGQPVPRTHDLVALLDRLQLQDKSLATMHCGAVILTPYAVENRYPGVDATKRQARAALGHASKVRAAVRIRLGLPV